MIDDEIEREVLVAAYTGASGSYTATYSQILESDTVGQDRFDAICMLEAKGLLDPQHVYITNTSGFPTQSICTLTRKGIDYIEKEGLVDSRLILSHQQAREQLQKIESTEAENAGYESSLFEQFDSEIQSSAKHYKHLK